MIENVNETNVLGLTPSGLVSAKQRGTRTRVKYPNTFEIYTNTFPWETGYKSQTSATNFAIINNRTTKEIIIY